MGSVPDQSIRAVSLRESKKLSVLVMLYTDHEIVRSYCTTLRKTIMKQAI